MSDKRYWFKAKKYGWGWGLPQTREGWIIFGVFILVWMAGLAYLLSSPSDYEIPNSRLGLFAIVILLDVAGLLWFSMKYGEPPNRLRIKKRK